ncbi:MAG: HDIG domain-containing protein [Clostridiales bacterium]|nr:HDIG domain-containing protein [Clostridiales bacterium]
MSHEPTREEAWQLLQEWVTGENLRRHMLAVEACMRAYARRLGEDEERWGIVGLVHDLDYERYPTMEDHPFRAVEFLRERGWPEDMLKAILGHANYSGVPRDTPMAQALFAVDELSGFITACALVRPDKSLENLEVKSVKKKLKDKAFARGVSREDIYQGAEEFGVPLDEHIAFCIEAMRSVEKELGLGVGT